VKETKELNRLVGAGINAGYASMEDGVIDFKDVSDVFDPLMKGQDGVQGIGEVGEELALATIDEKLDSTSSFANELDEVSSEDAFDITRIYGGIESAISLAKRATRKATLQAVAASLNESQGPGVASAEAWTIERLEAMIAE
jgi:hypothetical protein